MPAFSPAEIEEELKVLQDVPSLLSQYVEAEPAGKEGEKQKGGLERAAGGVRMISVGSGSMCLVLLACAGHEGQEPSLPKMRAGEPKAFLETVVCGGKVSVCSYLLVSSASLLDHPTLQREYESLLTLEGLQTKVSQCLNKLQLLRAGEPVPDFVVRCECGQLCLNSSLLSVCRTLWANIIFLLVIFIYDLACKILWWQAKPWYLFATNLCSREAWDF